jgi:A/G-specific adenine glycosylase
MLQQTQVATVIPYYERFLHRFPDIGALARAPLDDAIKLWEGLGYYARVRNLHAAVKIVVDRHGGVVPRDPETFRDLPGVGEYIVAAVMSIAFGAPLAVVDGNVKRLIARLFAIPDSVDRPAGTRAVREHAARLLDPRHAGDFNQALMELGALVCRPAAPDCNACPLAQACDARAQENPTAFPVRDARRAVPTQRIAVGVVCRDDRVLITRRAESAMLGGLWEFPGGKVEAGETPEAACAREIREEVNLDVDVGARVARVHHAYTHLRVDIDVFRCAYTGGDVVLRGPTEYRWILPEETVDYAFPKANHKFLPVLKETLAAASPRPARRRARSGKRRTAD